MNHVIIVDQDDRELEIVTRSQAHQEGLLHRISVVYLFDKKGNILIQERRDGRLDHSSAGHVDPGETYLEAARREIAEELGIHAIILQSMGKALSEEKNCPAGAWVRHIFEIFEGEGMPRTLHPEEVKDVFWKNPHDVLREMADDKHDKLYTGGFKSSLPVFLHMHNQK